MNFSLITLGELLSSQNEIIKRNAFSILKQLQKERDEKARDNAGHFHSGCIYPHGHLGECDIHPQY